MTDAAPRPTSPARPGSPVAPRPGDPEAQIPELGGVNPPIEPPTITASSSLADSLRSTQRAPGPAGQLLADAPNRAVGLLLDMIVIGLTGILVAATIGRALGGVVTDRTLATTGGDLSAGPFILVAVIVFALSLGYFALCWTRWHATPGMRLLGLAVLDDSGAFPLGTRQAIVRWVFVGIPATIVTLPIWAPSLPAMVLAILGGVGLVGLLVTIGQDPLRRGLHDRSASSIVTTVRRRSASHR
jgi:uncharacterized RDD family membrane protein YckC